MWDLRRTVDPTTISARPLGSEFRFSDGTAEEELFWLINEEGTVDLCLTDPGFDVDLDVRSDVASMTRVWLGDLALDRAVSDGLIELEGDQELSRRFRAWLQLSPFAAVMPAA